MNIVDLGLVYRAEYGPEGIEVTLTLSTTSCPLSEMIVEEVREVSDTSHRASLKVPRIVDFSSVASRRSFATSLTATCAACTVTPTHLNLAKVRDSDSGLRPSRAAISTLS